MSDQYTVVLPGNIEPHFNSRLERDAFIEWMHGLQATIAQQQARIDELKLALDKADPLDPSFLRYLELEQALAAERERAEKAEASQSAIAWAEQLHRAQIAEAELQAEREKSAQLERQLEQHAGLLHNSHHNWALYGVADCPELECEEYRALLSPAPEEK